MTDELREALRQFADAVEKLAFDMPAPNSYTPRFVQLCISARRVLQSPAPDIELLYGELPGMWDKSDLIGGETDAAEIAKDRRAGFVRGLQAMNTKDIGALEREAQPRAAGALEPGLVRR